MADQMMTDEAAPDMGAQAPTGFEICIRVEGDQISVGVESLGGDVESEGSEAYTPVGSIDEALSVAKDLFDNGGQVGDAVNADVMNGYMKGAPPKKSGKPTPGQVFGE